LKGGKRGKGKKGFPSPTPNARAAGSRTRGGNRPRSGRGGEKGPRNTEEKKKASLQTREKKGKERAGRRKKKKRANRPC